MASKLQLVKRVEMRSEVTEYKTTGATRTYKGGGSYEEELIRRVIQTYPAALLECGHWRDNKGSGIDLRNAKRLACWECERIARNGVHSLVTGNNPC